MTPHEKAVKVATTLLDRRGMEDVQETGGVCQLTCYDPEEGARCFVRVGIGDEFPSNEWTENMRSEYEAFAVSWLAANPQTEDCKVRFDDVSVVEVSEGGKFFARYVKNMAGRGN